MVGCGLEQATYTRTHVRKRGKWNNNNGCGRVDIASNQKQPETADTAHCCTPHTTHHELCEEAKSKKGEESDAIAPLLFPTIILNSIDLLARISYLCFTEQYSSTKFHVVGVVITLLLINNTAFDLNVDSVAPHVDTRESAVSTGGLSAFFLKE